MEAIKVKHKDKDDKKLIKHKRDHLKVRNIKNQKKQIGSQVEWKKQIPRKLLRNKMESQITRRTEPGLKEHIKELSIKSLEAGEHKYFIKIIIKQRNSNCLYDET